MTTIDTPDCPTVTGWSARRHLTRSGEWATVYSPTDVEGNSLDVWVFDGDDGLVEIGSFDFRTKAECRALCELLTSVLGQPVETERYMTGPMHAEPGAA